MTIHIGILPLDILHTLSASLQGEDGRTTLPFIHLPHPRTGERGKLLSKHFQTRPQGVPSLFLPSETFSDASAPSMILEVQAVAPSDLRSWFIGEEIIANGQLLVVTPVDPAFLLVPVLQAAHPRDGTLGSFRVADDIFEDASLVLQTSSQSVQTDNSLPILGSDVLTFTSLNCVREALRRICDVKEITTEIVVYRFSLQKLIEYLRIKVARLAVPDVLEISQTMVRGLAKDGLMEDGKESLLQVGRIRAACDLLSQYLPPDIRTALIESYDFSGLNEYYKLGADEAAAGVAVTANGGKIKATGGGVEMKRKGIKGSHGVEKLKKANVNGMAKLSSFFNKS